jgi:hypothetical protein
VFDMPTLIARGFMNETNTPFLWECSECDTVFSLQPKPNGPARAELERVDSEFKAHCYESHPHSRPVISGLEFAAGD